MSTISEIQQAIISLSKSDYAQLRRWLNEYDWAEWDQQIKADSDDGNWTSWWIRPQKPNDKARWKTCSAWDDTRLLVVFRTLPPSWAQHLDRDPKRAFIPDLHVELGCISTSPNTQEALHVHHRTNS